MKELAYQELRYRVIGLIKVELKLINCAFQGRNALIIHRF